MSAPGTVFQAKYIEYHTLVGFGRAEFPRSRGNCFSVKSYDGRSYNIVNFGHENLKELERRGLKFPIRCTALTGEIALLDDPRIGERWYCARYCEVCCPKDLLPASQLDAPRRDILRGIRTECKTYAAINLSVKPEFA